MHMNMAVHPQLLGARGRAAEIHPSVNTIELEIERAPVGTDGLAMPAPAVDESMRPGADPFLVHGINISPAAQTRK